MSDFEVLVYPVTISEHPDADALELAHVEDYVSIVQKGVFKDGDTVAYIPEKSIVPDKLIEEMGLTGRLSGSKKNRVKTVRLRGVVSQGLVYPYDAPPGTNVQEALGIVEHVGAIPRYLSGKQERAVGKTIHYDIQNLKKYPGVLEEGEQVVITEKLHGTLCQVGLYEGEPIVTSKGLGKRGVMLKIDDNNDNLYVQQYHQLKTVLNDISAELDIESVYIVGEIFGANVQDLSYGLQLPSFRAFDVHLGEPGRDGQYMSYSDMDTLLSDRVDIVPLLYSGPYSKEVVLEHTDGESTLYDQHFREGVVVKAQPDRYDVRLGRVQFKSVSEVYLLRKGGTEHE